MKTEMRRQLAIVIVAFVGALFATGAGFAQKPEGADAEESAIVAFAQQAALRALNFRQGDAQALAKSRADFTAEGWSAFLKHMQGWLDADGAPTITSSFTSTGNAAIAGRENGHLRIQIPGTLKQTQDHSSTTYRSYIEVVAGGKPTKILHLEQVACGGKRSTCP